MAWKWNGKYSSTEWPQWLPNPVVVFEENALYQKHKNSVVFFKPIVSKGFNLVETDLLYILVQTGKPVRVFKNEYLIKQDDNLLVMNETFLLNNYDLANGQKQ